MARAPSVVDGAFSFVAPSFVAPSFVAPSFVAPTPRACAIRGSGRGCSPLAGQSERRSPTPQGHQSLGLAQIVGDVAIGTFLARVAGPFEPPAPATALPALTKMPCRWHCERQRQDDGIHRHAAGNVLHSLVSSLPTEPPFFGRALNNCNLIFVGQPLKLFARLPDRLFRTDPLVRAALGAALIGAG